MLMPLPLPLDPLKWICSRGPTRIDYGQLRYARIWLHARAALVRTCLLRGRSPVNQSHRTHVTRSTCLAAGSGRPGLQKEE